MVSENNPEHNEKWKEFKERNLLRKLDVGLNYVTISGEDLASGTNEQLKQFGEGLEKQKSQKKFTLKVPQLPEEFPNLAKKKTNIYPLPISHENQCKTVGLASNLDLFSKEFGFKCEKAQTYLPLKSSGKNFDLDKANQRFAFMKALEKHKKEQATYEQILRREQEVLPENGNDHDDDPTMSLVVMDSDSSNDEDN